MNGPTIIRPACKSEIKPTESFGAPLTEASRRQYERGLVQKESEVTETEAALSERWA
ncbi:MAG: hypothetical protein IIB57_06425 [Planctomycetes bacterium]|nr:hypothetical protein [Planctomycetota bacterium]